MRLDDYDTDRIAEMRGETRMKVRALEERRLWLTETEWEELRHLRSDLKALTAEIRKRFVQLTLF